MLVSVHCITYNHAPFIEQCIKGVLMQKTNFKFEFVIGEDCSTDGTRDIIRTYAEKYPQIKLIISEVNVGGSENSKRTHEACTGKYIAFCEGDDYWIDPYKLQKQVDFLEANEDYGLVYTDNYEQSGCNSVLKPKIHSRKLEGSVFEDLFFFGSITTPTVLVRASILNQVRPIIQKAATNRKWIMGDFPLWLGISRISKIKYISDKTTVYRILPESASHSQNKMVTIRFYECSFDIRSFFIEKYNLTHLQSRVYENHISRAYLFSLLHNLPCIIDYKSKVLKFRPKTRKGAFIRFIANNQLLETFSSNFLSNKYIYDFLRRRRN
ncbi:glycosyltransferase [Ancylomarina salipaludis]|uniref:Glycosyltransferase n=1 Tax=Ancylomarina salipaludis TaxID=2501299 RepID=A0A4Q1JLP8_9BACT|nr:glycosyltransferase [Ancylomarina salipaludis]RXQ93859.1 glycosyltransferase [Ancylomarina salipaludis]